MTKKQIGNRANSVMQANFDISAANLVFKMNQRILPFQCVCSIFHSFENKLNQNQKALGLFLYMKFPQLWKLNFPE